MRALEAMATAFGERVAKAGLPAVKVEAGGAGLVAGDGDPAVDGTVEDLRLRPPARAVTARRTPDEIKAFDWDGDPSPLHRAHGAHSPSRRPRSASEASGPLILGDEADFAPVSR